MQITVKNYRGCEAAELALAPIALVCGKNEAGKTSIAQAVSAALTRNAAPIEGIAKNAARLLLRDGSSRGNCKIGDASGWAQANWPGASCTEDGNSPKASEIAAGIIGLVDLKQAERAALLIKVMDALPSRDDLAVDLSGKVLDKVVDAIWSVIESQGWDAAYKRAKTKGTELKGAWEQATGEKWGAVKGEDWKPAALTLLVNDDYSGFDERLSDANIALEDAIRNQAADGARRETLAEIAGRAAPELAPLKLRQAKLESEHSESIELFDAMDRPVVGNGGDCACPHCDKPLAVFSRSDVRIPEMGLSDDENTARSTAIAAANIDVAARKIALDVASNDIRKAMDAAKEINRARADLEALPVGTGSADDIEKAREKCYEWHRLVTAVKVYNDAGQIHRGIQTNIIMADALAADGLRQTVLAQKMAAFNSSLAHLCADASWPVVQVTDDLQLTYGGRPYVLLSASAQFRSRVIIQLVIAGMDGSDAVVIDAADILDKGGRNGLFQAVKSTKLKALICMTIDAPELVPSLSKAKLGTSYWIGGGILAAV
jgi:hypothetical protein